MRLRYETAAAFRRALTDHLNNRARREGTPVNRLQKQLTFERFLFGSTELLRRSVEATFDRYARHTLRKALPKPPPGWRETFAQLAAEVDLPERDLDDAYMRLEAFLASTVG